MKDNKLEARLEHLSADPLVWSAQVSGGRLSLSLLKLNPKVSLIIDELVAPSLAKDIPVLDSLSFSCSI